MNFLQILPMPALKIVEDNDLVATHEQIAYDHASDITTTTSYKNLHVKSLSSKLNIITPFHPFNTSYAFRIFSATAVQA